MKAVYAKCFKSGDEDEGIGPAEVERERELDEYHISP